jgi:hypothetical protein
VASSAQFATAVQAAITQATSLGQSGARIRSVASLIGTQVTIPPPAGSPEGTPTLVFPSPLNNATLLPTLLPLLMDQCTVQDEIEMVPRINVNTAPYEVLTSICDPTGKPMLTAAQAQTLMTQRLTQMQTPTAQATVSLAWLLTTGTLTPAQYEPMEKYITGTSSVYRVQVIGFFNSSNSAPVGTATATGAGYTTGSGSVSGNGAGSGTGPTYGSTGSQNGPVARLEAVIDTNQGAPRYLYIRDLNDIENPPGFPPSQPLQQTSGSSGSGGASQSGGSSGSGGTP